MSNQIKILHIVFSLAPGGMENGIINVTNLLREEDFQVDICCLEERGEFADSLPEQSRVAVLDKEPGKSVSTIWKLNKLIREWQPDIIHSHNLGPLIYASWATFGGRFCPILQGEHGQFPVSERSAKRLRQRRKYYGACRYIHTVSDSLRDQILDLNLVAPEKLVSLRNGVDTSRFCPDKRSECRNEFGFSDDMIVFGSVGRLVPSKRYADLMDAFERLGEPSTALLIAGDGECFEELKAKRESLKSKERIVLTGHCRQPDRVYNALDLFVLPSEIEGLSNAMLEAMATALPCLVSDACGNNDVIIPNENGFMMTMTTVDELCGALKTALAQHDSWQAIGNASRKKVEREFSLDAMAESYMNLYHKIMGGRD